MTLSHLPLSYCTNAHAGRTVAEVQTGVTNFSAPIRDRFGEPLAVGLWLARSVMDELAAPAAVSRFAEFLAEQRLTCHTLNAFPYGDFHSDRVKEQVYLPDWTTLARQKYTIDCARLLAALLPADSEGSISTVPLGFKELATASGFLESCCDPLLETARELEQIYQQTGRRIRLAIEPEPLCVLETTPETVQFFELLRQRAADKHLLDEVNEYLGVCYDVCHQSVEFEDVVASIQTLTAAGIRINKLHISCAIEARNVTRDPAVREALQRYIEPRYLHQTFARKPGGTTVSWTDLDQGLLAAPPVDFAAADIWRVHFHVPVDAEQLGPLQTTRPDLERALVAVRDLDYAPHLEVETYTWEVLPDGGRMQMVEGMSRELLATRRLLTQVSAS